MKQQRQTTQPLMKAAAQAMAAQRVAIETVPVNEAAVRAAAQAVAAAQADLAVEQARRTADIFAVLTSGAAGEGEAARSTGGGEGESASAERAAPAEGAGWREPPTPKAQTRQHQIPTAGVWKFCHSKAHVIADRDLSPVDHLGVGAASPAFTHRVL